MSAHVVYPALDPDAPATLSRPILTDLLRGELGFDGLILTDAMDMAAVSKEGALPSVQAALHAGADLVVLAHMADQMALHAAVADQRDAASEARIQRAREQAPRELPPLAVLGCAEHLAIAQAIADQSVTVVRAGCDFPLRLAEDERIVVITPEARNLTPADTSAFVQIALADAIRQRHAHTVALELPYGASESEIAVLLNACRGAGKVIAGTINAGADPAQIALVRALLERGDAPLVVSMRTPYDLASFPGVETYLCTYSIREVSMEAAARVLFGEIAARGVLPCAIPGIAAAGTGVVTE